MARLFEIIRMTDKGGSNETEIRLGIRFKIAGHETICSVSRNCNSFESLEMEIEAIKDNLDNIAGLSREIFFGPASQGKIDFAVELTPERIWGILSNTTDEDLFMHSFNDLDDAKRKDVAEYVLTRCSIFSGMASFFSARYNNKSRLLE